MDVRPLKSDSDVSLALPCGLTVHFRQAARPDGNLLVEPVQRSIQSTGNFENVVNDARDNGPFGPLVVVNQLGSWVNIAAHAASIGLREIEVWQNPRTSATLTKSRRYLYAPNEKIAALPNFKCGYSSLKNVFGQLWSAQAGKDGHAISLDGYMPVNELPAEFIFSIVRDPFERFMSFYVDKFMRPPMHFNYSSWRMPHQTLLGKDFGPDTMLWLIENTPVAFADMHWKPFSANLFHEGHPLVHRVYDISAAQTLSADLSEHLGRNISLPRVNVTDNVDHGDVLDKTQRAKARLEQIYAADIEFLARLKAVGGAADPSVVDLVGQAPVESAQTIA